MSDIDIMNLLSNYNPKLHYMPNFIMEKIAEFIAMHKTLKGQYMKCCSEYADLAVTNKELRAKNAELRKLMRDL